MTTTLPYLPQMLQYKSLSFVPLKLVMLCIADDAWCTSVESSWTKTIVGVSTDIIFYSSLIFC